MKFKTHFYLPKKTTVLLDGSSVKLNLYLQTSTVFLNKDFNLLKLSDQHLNNKCVLTKKTIKENFKVKFL